MSGVLCGLTTNLQGGYVPTTMALLNRHRRLLTSSTLAYTLKMRICLNASCLPIGARRITQFRGETGSSKPGFHALLLLERC